MTGQQQERVRSRFRFVQWAALLDLIFLVALVSALLGGKKEIIPIVGPLQ
jgi:hypothetical protein